MQLLPVSLKKNGMILEQVKRSERTAMYRVIMGSETGPTVGYEIWKITVDQPKKIFDREYPEMEHAPSNEDFGTLGFSWSSLEQAEKCYAEMEARKEEVKNA